MASWRPLPPPGALPQVAAGPATALRRTAPRPAPLRGGFRGSGPEPLRFAWPGRPARSSSSAAGLPTPTPHSIQPEGEVTYLRREAPRRSMCLHRRELAFTRRRELMSRSLRPAEPEGPARWLSSRGHYFLRRCEWVATGNPESHRVTSPPLPVPELSSRRFSQPLPVPGVDLKQKNSQLFYQQNELIWGQ